MSANAEVLLVRADGALILQQRDDKPGITNPGFVSTFGGGVEAGETPDQAALREIEEKTSLLVDPRELVFMGKYHKTKEVHGEDREVYYYMIQGITTDSL